MSKPGTAGGARELIRCGRERPGAQASGRSTPDNCEEFVILMGTQYPMLTYRGDVTDAQPGTLCGCDEVGRPYEIIEVSVYREGEPAYPSDADQGEMFCGLCERDTTHSHVYLQYASTENLNRQIDRLRRILQ